MTHENPNRPSFPVWLFAHALPAALLILVLAAIFFLVVKLAQHEPPPSEPVRVLPTVEVVEARSGPISIKVESQGTVEPRTETVLVAEVSGRVESISPAIYAGSFFKKGDLLVSIDPIDYQANLALAKSRRAEAQVAYQQELASSEQAREDWKAVGNEGSPDPLVLREPQLAQAKANLEAAETAVKTAERDLKRANVTAPYDGRVREKFVDIGQYLTARSSQIASIYSVDAAEVRLPLSLADTRYLELPEAYRDIQTDQPKPKVTLTANYGGQAYQWEGVIDRSEGAVDPQTRLVNVVARIDDPYGSRNGNPPLKIGAFVTASIHGKELEDAFVLPRKALRENDSVYVVTPEKSIEIRSVDVYQKNTDNVVVTKGIRDGELICLTPLQYVVDGMEVEMDDTEPAAK